MDYDILWAKITNVFNILNDDLSNNACTENEFNEVAEIISQLDILDQIETLIWIKIEKKVRDEISPRFWKYFSKSEDEDFYQFRSSVDDLYQQLSVYLPHLNRLIKLKQFFNIDCDKLNEFKDLIRATLYSSLPETHFKITKTYFEDGCRAFCNLEDKNRDEENTCIGCLCEQCRCEEICAIYFETNKKLVDLKLLESIGGQIIILVVRQRIESHVNHITKNSFDVSCVNLLENWLETTIKSWLLRTYCIQEDDDTPVVKAVLKFINNLNFYLIETYTKIRINQLFNIIIEYPESIPAIKDLKKCLEKSNLRQLLTEKLEIALRTRLLHPGVSTPDILTAYVAVIRSVRTLDPTGVLLDVITRPIHAYLRSRDDTVRCVVASLNDDGPSDLADELAKGDALQLDDIINEDDESIVEDNWQTWMPDPIHVDTSRKQKNRVKRTSDIISMLVNMYGSKELFVNEYRTLLADRLLSQTVCNTEKEIRYLELLKLRFGETQLHYCEVMLKDISDSRRINTHIQQQQEQQQQQQIVDEFPMQALILSAQFWPAFKDENLLLPDNVKDRFDKYTKSFEALKGNRTLTFKPHLGNVDLEVQLANRQVNLQVNPMQAAIILKFEQKPEWSLSELSHSLQVPATLLRKRMSFWQAQGILQEKSTDLFMLIEDDSSNSGKLSTTETEELLTEDDELESAMASSEAQREEELQVFWSYIIGMLTNLDSMPLERIHQMLKMFASQGPTAIECSLHELRVFLDRKVKEHKLLYINGVYRLPKT